MDISNINKMLNQLSKKLNIDKSKLENAAKSGQIDDVLKNADSSQTKQIQEVLSDPEKTKKILQSPQAQKLIKMFENDNKNN